MKATTSTDRTRIETAVAEMYRRPYMPAAALIERAARQADCGRRQLERAFQQFGSSPARELRAIRCELAAACLAEANWREKSESTIAERVGLRDARALRRVISAHWGIAPSRIRSAAAWQRELRRSEAAAERLKAEHQPGDPPVIVYDARANTTPRNNHIHKAIMREMRGASVEVRRFVEGDLRFPLPHHAGQEWEKLAAQRVSRRWPSEASGARSAG